MPDVQRGSVARPAGLLLGVAADALLGDPARWHPVAGFGRAAGAAERLWWADRRPRGVLHVAACVAPVLVGSALADRVVRARPVAHTLLVATVTWAVLGGRSLAREATALGTELESGDLDAARRRLPSLCGRDPSALDAGELARATVESVAENTSDAVVAPLFWGAVAGVPGLAAYRAVNTLDAMVGHRSPQYLRFGWASARLDDVLNLVPARLTAACVALVAPLVGGSRRAALSAWARDASRHPSPNAGPVEASVAGALGVRLGGLNRYGSTVEDRGPLGTGPRPRPADVRRAVRLCRTAAAASLAVCVGLAAVTGGRR